MREHQIVITLKPEQFLQVQKLARNAGAKSMGMFVRQQLLEALGIEGQAGGAGKIELEPVVSELKRLHYELKEFVSESLSAYSVQYDLQKETDAVPVEMEPGLPFVAESPSSASIEADAKSPSVFDELEEAASRAFAISPRLGAIEADSKSESIQHSGREDFAEPDKSRVPLVDSNSQTRRDPLSELLSASEVGSADREEALLDDPDDDTYDVPLSILARRQQLAAQLKAVESQSADPAKTLDSNLKTPADTGNADKSELSEKKKSELPDDEDKPKKPNSQTVSGSHPKYAPLENRDDDTPFSGGPPPKKRQ